MGVVVVFFFFCYRYSSSVVVIWGYGLWSHFELKYMCPTLSTSDLIGSIYAQLAVDVHSVFKVLLINVHRLLKLAKFAPMMPLVCYFSLLEFPFHLKTRGGVWSNF